VLAADVPVRHHRQPPFWRHASLGGRAIRAATVATAIWTRSCSLQAEYRAPVVWRLSLSGFGGAAAVAPEIPKFRWEHLHPTVGFGINAHYKKNQAIIARFDTAFGEEGIRFDLAINESF
jgi:hypothetical protein